MKNREKEFKKSREKMGKNARSKLDQIFTISHYRGMMRAVPDRGADSEINGLVNNYTDITKHKKVIKVLRDNKLFLQYVFDGIQEGISILDKDLNIIETNYWIENMYESQIPLIGKKCYVIYQKRKSPCPWCPSLLTLKTDDVHSAIAPYPSIENPIRWLEIITYPFKNSDGLTIGVIEYIKDFTEHKHMQEKLQESENKLKKINSILEKKVEERNRKLKESEEKYRFLFENSPYAITLIDLSGKIIDCNPSLERLFNYNKNNLIGKNFKNLAIIPKDFSQTLSEAFDALIRGRTIESLELQHFPKDGNMIWTKSKASLVNLGDKKLIQVLTENITQMKDTQLKLKESEEKYRTLTEQSFIGIAIAQDNKVKYINDTITKISGYTVQELKKFTFEDIKNVIHPDDSDFVLDQFRKKQRGNVNIIKNYQYRLFKKNGNIIWIDSYSKPIIYEDKPADFITVIDITDRKKAEEALKESEEKFRRIAEHTFIGIDIIQDNKIVYCNQALSDIAGYSREEILHSSINDLIESIHQDYRESILDYINTYQQDAEKSFSEVEFPFYNKKAELKWVRANVNTINYLKRNAMLTTLIDITEKKQAELALKESEEKFRNIAEQSLMGIIILQDGVFKYFNDRISKMNAYSAEEMKDWAPNEFLKAIHPEDREFVMEQARKKQAGDLEVIHQYRYRTIRKNREIRWMEIFSKTITYEGRPADLAMIIDITDKVKAEKQLKESEEKFRNLINNISDVLMEGDIDGTITYISHKIYDLAGYLSEELIGFKFFEFIHPNDKVSYKKLISQFKKAGDKFTMELRMFHKKGYYVPISAKFSLEEINKKLKIFVVIRDITEKRKIDKMMKKEIEKLKEIDRIRNNLVRRISHELKTPLISIFSGSQYLLEKYKTQLNDNIQDIVKIIHKGGYRLKNLVDNLLFAYSIESNELILNLKRENLIPIIKNCINDLIFIANKRQVFINVELIKELYLEIDKFKIGNIISNILLNAIKNTPPKGSIYIETFEHPQYIDIIIKDDGVGLTKKEIPFLFQKFGKIERFGKNMNIDMEGPGLGLYISNEIIKKHNGEIIVKSKGRNMGSIFIIRLNRSKKIQNF
ncbi:MAG: PAS domain S-box protein [Promethearchaeota archaeon]